MDMCYLFNKCDVITDRYYEGSLKKGTREDHGSGAWLIVTFDDSSDIFQNFISKFLSNVTHTTNLNKYLANKCFVLNHYLHKKKS